MIREERARNEREQLRRQVAELRPHQLSTYLSQSGWRDDGAFGKFASIWHRPEPELLEAEVLAPISSVAKDFFERMADAVSAIGVFEGRTAIDVAKTVAGTLADAIRVRVFHDDVEDGSIPLEDGVLLNQKARDLMASAVMSTLSKRRHFAGSRPPEAAQYLASLRLGQTEIGSYVVNVIAPAGPPRVDQTSIPLTSFASVVSENLASGLNALSAASNDYETGEDLSVFDAAVQRGASANMCDALVGLSGSQRQRGFEISISPLGNDMSRQALLTFLFEPARVATIAAASEYYKDNYVLLGRLVVGLVKRLDRRPGDESGTVTIATTISDSEKNVMVELGNDEYLEAIAAHRAKQPVQVTGDLHVSPRTARLLNPQGFGVLRSGDLF